MSTQTVITEDELQLRLETIKNHRADGRIAEADDNLKSLFLEYIAKNEFAGGFQDIALVYRCIQEMDWCESQHPQAKGNPQWESVRSKLQNKANALECFLLKSQRGCYGLFVDRQNKGEVAPILATVSNYTIGKPVETIGADEDVENYIQDIVLGQVVLKKMKEIPRFLLSRRTTVTSWKFRFYFRISSVLDDVRGRCLGLPVAILTVAEFMNLPIDPSLHLVGVLDGNGSVKGVGSAIVPKLQAVLDRKEKRVRVLLPEDDWPKREKDWGKNVSDDLKNLKKQLEENEVDVKPVNHINQAIKEVFGASFWWLGWKKVCTWTLAFIIFMGCLFGGWQFYDKYIYLHEEKVFWGFLSNATKEQPIYIVIGNAPVVIEPKPVVIEGEHYWYGEQQVADYIGVKDALGVAELYSLFEKLGIRWELVEVIPSLSMSDMDFDSAYNIILIGGPNSNQHTLRFLRSPNNNDLPDEKGYIFIVKPDFPPKLIHEFSRPQDAVLGKPVGIKDVKTGKIYQFNTITQNEKGEWDFKQKPQEVDYGWIIKFQRGNKTRIILAGYGQDGTWGAARAVKKSHLLRLMNQKRNDFVEIVIEVHTDAELKLAELLDVHNPRTREER